MQLDRVFPACGVAFYAFFTFWGLGSEITALDEARFWLAARAVATGLQRGWDEAWLALARFDHEPGRLLLLLPAAAWGARAEWVIRLPAALLNLLSLWPLYRILRFFYRDAAAILLCAYSLLIGWIAVYALAITPGYGLFAIWLWYCFLRLLAEKTPKALLAYALVNSLALFFYLEFAVFFLPAAAAALFIPGQVLWRTRIAWTALSAALGAGLLLAAWILSSPAAQGLASYISSRLQEWEIYFNYPEAVGFYAGHTSLLFVHVGFGGLAYYLCLLLTGAAPINRQDPRLWSLVFFLPHLLVWGLFFRAAAYGHFAAAFPLFFLWAADFAVASGRLRHARSILFGLACVLAFVQSLHLFWLYAPPPAFCLYDRAWQTAPNRRSPSCGMREAGAWLRRHTPADETIITNGPATFGPLYAERPSARSLAEADWYVHFRSLPWLGAAETEEMHLCAETPRALIFWRGVKER
ncbi:MAG: glycosyltransferase family 39 protein [Planctomycetota bacterium]|nr:glycosyltransferase family 39 protein [Planctomycetota bacterium]